MQSCKSLLYSMEGPFGAEVPCKFHKNCVQSDQFVVLLGHF